MEEGWTEPLLENAACESSYKLKPKGLSRDLRWRASLSFSKYVVHHHFEAFLDACLVFRKNYEQLITTFIFIWTCILY